MSTTNLRKERGYRWETRVAEIMNANYGWQAVRLGSPSINLPDVFAVNDRLSTVLAIECKSGSTNYLIVPFDQIERSIHWVNMFKKYDHKIVYMAFRFMSLKWFQSGYRKRQLRDYWFEYNLPLQRGHTPNVLCNYDGKLEYWTESTSKKRELTLPSVNELIHKAMKRHRATKQPQEVSQAV